MNKVILRCILTMLLMQCILEAQAQLRGQARIDSLLTEIQKAEEDTNKVKSLIAVSRGYRRLRDFQKAKSYASEALTLSQKIEFRKGEGNANEIIGLIYKDQNNYPEAIKYIVAELEIRKEIGENNEIPHTYNDLAEIYCFLGNYPEAIKNLYASLKLVEKTGDKLGIATLTNNIGNIYRDQGNYPEALKNHLTALKIYEEVGDKGGIASVWGNIGIINERQGNYPEALKDYGKTLELYEQIGDKKYIAGTYDNLGLVYAKQRNYAEALKNHFAALKIREEMKDKLSIASSYHSIGSTYIKLKKFDEARKYLNDALSLVENFGMIMGIKFCYEALSELDSATGNYKSALEHYKLYVSYRDSLVNEENTRKITQQQMQYEFDKKQAAARAEQEKKDIRQRNVRYSMIAGLAGLIIFLLVVFRQRNKIAKEKKRSDELLVRSDNLLLNILPSEVADEIKREGHSKARTFSMVTVMFTDFKDFTAVSEKVSAELLVAEIDHCFSAFDNIIQKYGVEKIKTIGDAYMCVGGMPALTLTHATDIVKAAIEIRNFMMARKKEQETKGGISFELRLGVHTGPVVAGIVGVKKYAYDIWGDTVNIAARMEQHGEAGKINISGSTYKLVKEKFNCTYRGKIEAKNKGEVEMYFVENLNHII